MEPDVTGLCKNLDSRKNQYYYDDSCFLNSNRRNKITLSNKKIFFLSFCIHLYIFIKSDYTLIREWLHYKENRILHILQIELVVSSDKYLDVYFIIIIIIIIIISRW